MPNRIEWIQHKGKSILKLDYSGLSEEEYCQTVDKVREILLTQPKNSILSVVTISHGNITDGILRKARFHRLRTKDHLKAVAAVGLSGILKIIVEIIYRDVYFAKTYDEALNWLVKQ